MGLDACATLPINGEPEVGLQLVEGGRGAPDEGREGRQVELEGLGGELEDVVARTASSFIARVYLLSLSFSSVTITITPLHTRTGT